MLLLACTAAACAQTGSDQSSLPTDNQQPGTNPPLSLTFQDALARAKKNNPEYRAALTEVGLAREDRVQGRAALLPSIDYASSFIYTEGNGTQSARFIANNGVHEYISQGGAHEDISLATVADYRRTRALEALARARAEIVARGLVLTVVQAYYGFVTAQRKFATANGRTPRPRGFSISARSSSTEARSPTRTSSKPRFSFNNNNATCKRHNWRWIAAGWNCPY